MLQSCAQLCRDALHKLLLGRQLAGAAAAVLWRRGARRPQHLTTRISAADSSETPGSSVLDMVPPAAALPRLLLTVHGRAAAAVPAVRLHQLLRRLLRPQLTA